MRTKQSPVTQARGDSTRRIDQRWLVGLEYVGVRELNQNTSAVLQRVREGHGYTVTDRGVPVAYLIPAQPGDPVLDHLVSAGRARPPHIPQGIVPMPPVLGDSDVDSAAALAADREDERW